MGLSRYIPLLLLNRLMMLHSPFGLPLREGTMLASNLIQGKDKRCTLPLLEAFTNMPATECAVRCEMDTKCGGINVSNGSCEVVNGKATGSLANAIGYTYYEKFYYDYCQLKPCQNGATCRSEMTRLVCTCIPGYTGEYCEININDCLQHRCVHGSTCIDGINTYTCRCLPGYSGQFCEVCPVMKMGPNCDQDCTLTARGIEYNGTVSRTQNGRTCQRWNSQSPQWHFYTKDSMYPDGSVWRASNYCRNPRSLVGEYESKVWCYTTNLFVRWEYCNIPICV